MSVPRFTLPDTDGFVPTDVVILINPWGMDHAIVLVVPAQILELSAQFVISMQFGLNVTFTAVAIIGFDSFTSAIRFTSTLLQYGVLLCCGPMYSTFSVAAAGTAISAKAKTKILSTNLFLERKALPKELSFFSFSSLLPFHFSFLNFFFLPPSLLPSPIFALHPPFNFNHTMGIFPISELFALV